MPISKQRAVLLALVVAPSFLLIISLLSIRHNYKKNEPLRVAYPINSSALNFDPARIDTTTQANIIRNLYGRLIEYNANAEIEPCIAEFFEWRGDEVRFTIRDGLKTVDGWPITAEDVSNSLKRLMIKDTNTHGNLASFLCPNSKLKTMSDTCDGLHVEGKQVVFKPVHSNLGKFFVPLLASVDFSIIPSRAINFKSAGLEISDYRNTTGAYYVEKDDIQGRLKLSANPSFHLYSKDMAQTIQLVPVEHNESIEKFRNNEVDLITTPDPASPNEVVKLANDVKNSSLHRTLNIQTYILRFTRIGQRHLTVNQRIALGRIVRKVYLEKLDNANISPTLQFFPTFGDGGLDKTEVTSLQNLFSETKQPDFKQKAILSVSPFKFKRFSEAFKDYNFIELRSYPKPSWLLPEAEQPDMSILDIDSAFNEDVSMISYNADAGTFGMSREQGAIWLDQYMKVEDKNERLRLLRKLHFTFLSEATVVPIGNAPYIALARSPWKIHFSHFFAGTPLWLVK